MTIIVIQHKYIQYRPVGKGTPTAEMINFVAWKFVWHGGSPLRHVNTLG